MCEVVTTIKSQLDGGTIKGLAMFDSKRSKRCRTCRPRRARPPEPDRLTWNAIFLPKGAP